MYQAVSNALANVTRRQIGLRHEFATLLSCDILSQNSTSLRNVAFHWLVSGFMQLESVSMSQ